MDRVRATVAVFAMSSLLLSGCSLLSIMGVQVGPPAGASATATVAVGASCDEFNAAPAEGTAQHALRAMTYVKVGEPFTVTLCSNATTGFTWEAPVLSGDAGLEVVDHTTAAPGSSLVGAAGTETWTLVAGTAGSGKADFAYSRPWEGGEKGVWTYELSVSAS